MNGTTIRSPQARIAVRAGAFVAVLASGALALTACSSGGSSSSAATNAASASASGGAGGQDMNAYRQCLAQHGVNLPTFNRPSGGARPSGRPSGAGRPSGSARPSGGYGGGFGGFGGGIGGASPDAATQKALKACASKAPSGRGGPNGTNSADASAIQAFTSCLKDHGVTLPTASAGTGGGGFGALRNLDTADPKTAKAYTTCKPLLPQRPTSTASPSTT
ncbi:MULTISPECIES: hypothetical protein [Streptomycetaceae]|uniref:hypothetical protein n=1 Tax=Streptomycetaceae TaxID=2062 RepID=UPI0030087954